MSTPVQTAGIYSMPLEEYVNDPAPEPSLNAGAAHTILTQSPKHAWIGHPKLNPSYQSDESSRLDLGTIAHAMFLEGDDSKVAVIEADDWRTKAAREQRDEARLAGKNPILKKDLATVKLMVSIAVDALYGHKDLCEAWMEATPEQTLIWQENDIWCRSRPDKLTSDGRLYFDYKTVTTANPNAFGRGPLIRNGYDIQAALGIRGVKATKQAQETTVIFVCQEIEPPYAVSFVSLSPAFMAIAQERLELAMHQWGKCLATGRWPGYSQQVAFVEPPSYYGMESADDYL